MTEDAAVREWTGLAYAVAQGFYFPGADSDDVRQEALVGLLRGLRNWDPARNEAAGLRPWLAVCIRRHLVSALDKSRRVKRGPLNEALRELEPDDRTLAGLRGSTAGTASSSLSALLAPLTPVERRAVVGVACGMAYAELGQSKSVDNALKRARQKLRAA